MSETQQYKLGIDIGGTFTDLTLIVGGGRGVHTHKVPSTPDSPSRAVAQGTVELEDYKARGVADPGWLATWRPSTRDW